MLFNASNYKRMIIAFLMVLIGFTAMYIENEVEGFISLYVSPILIVGGYALVVHAILVKSESKDEAQKA